MEVSIIQIGNSRGIRIAKKILEKYEIIDSVELILKEDCLILRPIKKAREGWEDSFRKMAEKSDDKLLIEDVFEDENLEEWN